MSLFDKVPQMAHDMAQHFLRKIDFLRTIELDLFFAACKDKDSPNRHVDRVKPRRHTSLDNTKPLYVVEHRYGFTPRGDAHWQAFHPWNDLELPVRNGSDHYIAVEVKFFALHREPDHWCEARIVHVLICFRSIYASRIIHE